MGTYYYRRKGRVGRPIKKWKKTAYKGRWENSVKTIRSMTGDNISSTGNVILPVLIDIKKEFLIEKGLSNGEEPTLC